MEKKRVTSHELVTQYLIRIAMYEHKLHAAITINPNALKEADELDRERAPGKVRGPLHGIPIALKDNIHTTEHADHRRRAGVRRPNPALRSDAHQKPARCRRDHHRENRSDRACQLGRRRSQRRCPAITTQSADSATTPTIPAPIRAKRPSTAGRRCKPADRARESAPRRVSGRATWAPIPAAPSSARRIQHAGRHPADHRPHQPLWRDPDHRRPRHRRSDDPNRRRRRHPAGCRSKVPRRTERSGNAPTARRRRAATTRSFSKPTHSKAPASASRARSITTASLLPGENSPRGGLNPEQAKAMAGRDRGPEEAGGRDCRSGRHSQLRRQGPQGQFLVVALLLRRRTRPRATTKIAP